MWLGNFTSGSTLDYMFTTVGSSGAPESLSSAAVVVYRGGSTSNTSSGVVLTASYDAVTGMNKLEIDMANTSPFYIPGENFMAVVSSGGTATVANMAGYVVCQWSVGHRDVGLDSTAGLETATGFSTHSTAGLETASSIVQVHYWGGSTVAGMPLDSTAGLETLSTVGIETATGFSTHTAAEAGAAVWNSTRASYTAAGSFGELVSTSTAAPDQWVATASAGGGSSNVNVVQWGGSTVEGMPIDSTAGLETLSTVGIETASSSVNVTEWAGNSVSVSGQSLPQVSLEDIDGNLAAAGRLRQWITSWDSGTIQTTSTTQVISLGTAATEDDFYNGDLIVIYSGTGSGQARTIVDYDGSSAIATLSNPFVPQSATDSDFIILPGGRVDIGAIDGSVTASSNLELMFNGTGYAGGTTPLNVNAIEWGGSTVEGMPIDSTAGLETLSTVGIETASSIVEVRYWGGSTVEGMPLASTVGLETATGFSTLGSTEIFDKCSSALAVYDGPTHAELNANSTATDTLVVAKSTETQALIQSLNDISTTDVNDQVVDALNVDTYGEPTGAPPATASLVRKIGQVYMVQRNQITVSSSNKTFYDDAGNAAWGKVLTLDSTGSTGVYTEAEASTST